MAGDGIKYRNFRHDYNIENLASRFSCAADLLGIDIDSLSLARYVYDERGRYCAKFPSSSMLQRLEKITHYPYVTRSDKDAIGIGVSSQFLGNSSIGYEPIKNYMKVSQFIEKYVYLDSEKERVLTQLYKVLQPINQGKQNVFKLKQRLTKIYKDLEKEV